MEATGVVASLFLDYAENVRRKLEAGSLRSSLAPEGPHNTTEGNKRKNRIARFPVSHQINLYSFYTPFSPLPASPRRRNSSPGPLKICLDTYIRKDVY